MSLASRALKSRPIKPAVYHTSRPVTSKFASCKCWHPRTAAAALRNPSVLSKEPKDLPVYQRGQGRTIVVAVDGKKNGIEGLKWLIDNCFNAGDSIVLITVVNNDRALPVSVGMTAPTGRVLTVSLDDFDDYAYERTKAYGSRLAKAAQAHVDKVYKPLVEKAGFEVEAHVNIVEGHASAAAIAESIVNFAEDRCADILAVTSHVSYLKELQDATSWGAQHMLRGGDRLHVLHAKEAAVSVDDATHQMTIMAGLREQFQKHKIKDLTYTLIQSDGADEEAVDFNTHSASALLAAAAKKRSKALVMVNYAARGLMQEMMFGTLAMLVSRSATMPLALIPTDYAVE